MKSRLYITIIALFILLSHTQAQYRYQWSDIEPRFDSIANLLDQATFNDEPRKQQYNHIKQLYNIAQESQNQQLSARANYWAAWSISKVNIDSTAILLDKAFAQADSSRYPYDHARLRFLKGVVFQSQGEWSYAYQIYKEQENFFAQCGDRFSQAKVTVCMGTVLQELNEYKKALEYYRNSSYLFESIGCINCYTKNQINISNILYLLGQKEDALKILEDLEQNSITQQDTLYMANVLISLFCVSDQQISYAPYKAHRLMEEIGFRPLYPLTLLSIGRDKLNRQENDSALYYFNRAWNEALQNNDIYHMSEILQGLSSVYSIMNNADSAYHYLLYANTIRDTLLSKEKISELNRIENRATIEQYEAGLLAEHKKNEYRRNIATTICLFLALVSVLLCYIFWLAKRKAGMSEQLKIAENRELQLLNNQYRIEIESKNRELASNTLILAQKNSRLKDLYEQIEQLKEQGTLPDKESEEIKSNIHSQLISDDWQYFILHFEQAHPHFLTRLKEQYSCLSENELRMCAYIRIGMSSKEIAQVLSVQPETINTSRYRIRKKLGLTAKTSLEDILRNI